MAVSAWMRQTHRWTSVCFISISAAIWITLGAGLKPAAWIYFVPLLPLGLLAVTGVYMFILPYRNRPRGGSSAERDA